jgi:hypothetical protein
MRIARLTAGLILTLLCISLQAPAKASKSRCASRAYHQSPPSTLNKGALTYYRQPDGTPPCR